MLVGKIIHPSQLPQIGQIQTGELHRGIGKSEDEKNSAQGFADLLSKGIGKVNDSIKEYEALSTEFANGEHVNLHEMIVKGEHADINLRLMMSIRNKIVDAYNEVMRMPI